MPTRNSRMLLRGRSAKPCSGCGKIPNNWICMRATQDFNIQRENELVYTHFTCLIFCTYCEIRYILILIMKDVVQKLGQGVNIF